MKLRLHYTSFIICFLMVNAIAQKKQNVYFLKADGRYVDSRDSADFTRIVQEPDSGSVLYHVLEYFPNGNIKLISKSSTVDPVKLEGQLLKFYLNKNKQQVANYYHGNLQGSAYDYYPNGKIYRSIEYLEQPKDISNLPYSSGPEEVVHTVFDSTGVETVHDGNGHYLVFDADYKNIEEEGELKGGKRNGTWKGHLSKSKLTFTEDYADGKFIKGTSTDAAGNTKNYTVKEALPTFVGGDRGFGNFLSHSIKYPDAAKRNNVQGKVIVAFVVEADGKLADIKIISHVSYEIDEEVYRVISDSPKWNPALQHGVPVKVSYTMPVSFTLQGN